MVMGYFEFLRPFLVDNFAGALIAGFLFSLGTSFLWRAFYKGIHDRFPDKRSAMAKIVDSVRVPGFLIFFTLGFRVFLTFAPDFQSKATWTIAADLSTSFLAIIMLCEGVFAFFIDFYPQEHRKTEIPSIFKQLFKVLAYLVVALSFLSTTYKIDITPLLTTSAIFSMVIGLALQDVLMNLFSGLSVHISPPFKLGDWIKVAGFMGKVVESNWRATTLRTPAKEIVVLPNNDIAKKDIVNLSFREGLLMIDFVLGVSYEASPEKVRKTLVEACEQVKTIVSVPKPTIYMENFGDFAISYRIRYWIPENAEQTTVKDQLASRIWYKFKREKIVIPYPIREVYMHPEKDTRDAQVNHRLALMSQIDFLKQLDRRQQVYIAEHLLELWYEAGETIFRKGAEGSEFYIIDQGKVAVYLDDGALSPIAHLKEGDFFGEMSLLTGELRSATIMAESETRLLMLNQETVRHLLEEKPAIASMLSEVLTERSAKNQARRPTGGTGEGDLGLPAEGQPTDTNKTSILFDKIKRFFRMG